MKQNTFHIIALRISTHLLYSIINIYIGSIIVLIRLIIFLTIVGFGQRFGNSLE